MIGTKILEEKESKFNGHLRVVKSWGMGTYIQAEGLTQSGGVVESIWKSTLKKINNSELIINNCLILGLGGGTVAKLIRKNWPDTKITGVDIDPVMIELGKKYLDLDKKIKIIISDAGRDFGKFDLVIVDLYNGDQFPKKFESIKFLKNLAKNRLVVFNRLYYKDKKIEAENFGQILKKVYKTVKSYRPPVNMIYFCQ